MKSLQFPIFALKGCELNRQFQARRT